MSKTHAPSTLLRPLRSAQVRVRRFAFRTTMGATNPNAYAPDSFPYSKRPQG